MSTTDYQNCVVLCAKITCIDTQAVLSARFIAHRHTLLLLTASPSVCPSVCLPSELQTITDTTSLKRNSQHILPCCRMQTQSSDENSVRLPSSAWIVTKRKKNVSRSFGLVFWVEEWLVGTTPSILGQRAPVGAKSPILNRYSLVTPQP